LNSFKKLIFISHSVPSDDYLAIWLASKLRLMGYEVWIDKEDLRSGGAFWNEIDIKIRQQSIRFLALVSDSYIQKSRERNSGVFLELNAAKTVSKEVENYVIPLKVDNSNYDDFPLITLGIDTIDFSKNWGSGLKKLLKEFEVQSIFKSEPEPNVLTLWHKYQGIKGEVKEQLETYGSNWFQCSLPKYISVYKFQGDLKLINKYIPFPFVRNGDYCLGFFDDIDLDVKTEYREDILVEDFLTESNYLLKTDEEIKDTEPKFVNLMNKAIYNFFYINKSFKAYSISNDKKVIYPVNTNTKSGYVTFSRAGKKVRRHLKGNKPVNWSFGLSFVFQLTPFPHYKANHHLLSSNQNGFFEKDEQLRYRRSIPKEWYNRDWFERILAFMNLAAGSNLNIQQFTFQSGRELITLDLNTVCFLSNFSYEES
jgi:hypothetical protein